METTTLSPIDTLKMFCAKQRSRYAIDVPFMDGQWAVATDGRVCVRIIGVSIEQPEGKFPPMQNLVWSKPKNGPHPIPSFDMPTPKPCAECNSTGIVPGHRCDECDGDGEIECWECGHERECSECGGEGDIPEEPCKQCRGSKIVERLRVEIAPGFGYDAEYLDRLRKAGATDAWLPDKQNHAAYFEIDGGEALLMPLIAGV